MSDTIQHDPTRIALHVWEQAKETAAVARDNYLAAKIGAKYIAVGGSRLVECAFAYADVANAEAEARDEYERLVLQDLAEAIRPS